MYDELLSEENTGDLVTVEGALWAACISSMVLICGETIPIIEVGYFISILHPGTMYLKYSFRYTFIIYICIFGCTLLIRGGDICATNPQKYVFIDPLALSPETKNIHRLKSMLMITPGQLNKHTSTVIKKQFTIREGAKRNCVAQNFPFGIDWNMPTSGTYISRVPYCVPIVH